MGVGMMKVLYVKGSYEDHKVATALTKMLKDLETSQKLEKKMNAYRVVIDGGVVDFYEVHKIHKQEENVKRMIATSISSRMGLMMRKQSTMAG